MSNKKQASKTTKKASSESKSIYPKCENGNFLVLDKYGNIQAWGQKIEEAKNKATKEILDDDTTEKMFIFEMKPVGYVERPQPIFTSAEAKVNSQYTTEELSKS